MAADRRADHHVPRLLARRHPVPRGPRGQQRPRVVPAAQGRVRAPPQGADGGDDRGARRAARGARRPDPRRSEEGAVPDLPRHALQQGQVAVQDAPRRKLSVGRRIGRPRARASGSHEERTHGNGGVFPLPARRDVRRRRDVADGEVDHRRRSARSCATTRTGCAAALEEPAFVGWWGDVAPARRAEALPARLAAGPPAGASMFLWKDIVFGRRLSDDEALSPDLPGPARRGLRRGDARCSGSSPACLARACSAQRNASRKPATRPPSVSRT